MSQNTGYKGFANRRRLVNGVPDGYTEPNTPGPNYIPPILDLTSCPVPDSSGKMSILITNLVLSQATLKITDTATSDVIYTGTIVISGSSSPSNTIITLPNVSTKIYKLEISVVTSSPSTPFKIICSDQDKGSGVTTFNQSYIGTQSNVDCGNYNTDISVQIVPTV